MTTHSTSKHKYIQLTDTIDKQTNSIAQLVDKVRRKIPVVNQSAKDVEEVTCRLEARAEVAKSEIQKCFPRILKALQEREKVMFAEVENSVARKSKVLNNQQERLETELQKLQLTCTFTGQCYVSVCLTDCLCVCVCVPVCLSVSVRGIGRSPGKHEYKI